MQKLVILGGSNAFWEIYELIKDINLVSKKFEIIGVLDDNPILHGVKYDNIKVNGSLDKAIDFDDDVMFVFAVGSYSSRLERAVILKRLNIQKDRFVTLIHPSVKIFSNSIIKNGCIVHYGTVIFNHTVINDFSVISANCVIASNNYLGKGSMFGSNVLTTRGVKIGAFCNIGSSTNISENIEIEPGVQIGMGSLVLKDVKAGVFAFGNPLRMLDKIEVPQTIIEEWNIEKNKLTNKTY